MAQFNITDAKAHFSALVRRASMGEEVIIARNNKPVLRLVPIKSARQPGSARGQVWMAEDFEETPKDLKEYL